MRRVSIVGLLVVGALMWSRPASAQLGLRAGIEGKTSDSVHADVGEICIAWAFYGAGHLDLRPAALVAPAPRRASGGVEGSIIASARFGHAWGNGAASEFLAGLRFTNRDLLKFPVFVEAQAGFFHAPGMTRGLLEPAVGIVFKKPEQHHGWYVKVGTPLFLNGLATEFGIMGGIGLDLSTRK